MITFEMSLSSDELFYSPLTGETGSRKVGAAGQRRPGQGRYRNDEETVFNMDD